MDGPDHQHPGSIAPPPPLPPPAPACITCGYELTGLRVEEVCPECGRPVWEDIEPRALEIGRVYARAESSFYAAALAVVLAIGCGPFGLLVGVWAMWTSIVSITQRHQNRGPSRNMPFISAAISALALGVSALWVVRMFF